MAPPKVRGRQASSSTVTSTLAPLDTSGSTMEDEMPATPSNKPRTRGSSEPRTPAPATPQQQEQRFGKRGSGQAFALGLFKILETEDPSIIGWSSSGKAFRIGDSEKFCRDIMPRFFKQNKYSSFQRQLNLYGFRKLVRGNEAGGYMHPLFERGKPEQLSQVRRGYFPEIPPEFAHDVHGHGANDTGGDPAIPNGTPSRAVPRGRKSENGRTKSGSGSLAAAAAIAASGGSVGGGHAARSSSVGRSGRDMSPQDAVAAAAMVGDSRSRGVLLGKGVASNGVNGRSSPGGAHRPLPGRMVPVAGSQGHVRSGSGSIGPLHGGQGAGGLSDGQPMGFLGLDSNHNAMDTEWDGNGGRLPSLNLVTGDLRLPGRHGGAGGHVGGAEMPPTLGRLVPSADNPSRESSPMKPARDLDGRRRRVSAAGNLQRSMKMEPPDGRDEHPLAYGRSQDDLSVSPRTHGHAGLSALPNSGGLWHNGNGHSNGNANRAGGVYHDHLQRHGGTEFFNSNSSNASSRRGQRPLQHMRSRDDLDALRPRKTRRTGASFHHDDDGDDNLAPMSPRPGSDGDEYDPDGLENEVPMLPGAVSYASPDEVPPAPPRRLVSKHNTPSRPNRIGAGNGNVNMGRGKGRNGRLMNLSDPNLSSAMEAGGAGSLGTSQGYNSLKAQGFYAAMSPVTVGAARGGFGGRRHHRHHSSSAAQRGSMSTSMLDENFREKEQRDTRDGWMMGDMSPDDPALGGDSPASRSSTGGGSGMGGLGLTAHAMSRMEQVKTHRQETGQAADGGQQGNYSYTVNLGNGNAPQGVQALGEDLSQLDLSERPLDAVSSNAVGDAGQGQLGALGLGQGHFDASQGPQSQLVQNHGQIGHGGHRQSHLMQNIRDGGGTGGGHKRTLSGVSGKGASGEWTPSRRPTAAEAAELLRRRSSVDEVIGLLSAPAGDGGFEDEGIGRDGQLRNQQCDPAQFDSWRNSLTKVLGHLGFDLMDEEGMPVGPEDKKSPAKCNSSRGASQFLSWGGTSAMSFEDQPEEFHESLRQIPMRWRSSLSSIMTSMASNGGGDDGGGGAGGGGGLDVDGADGKGSAGERKRLEQQASLEMLQSVMRETLESMHEGGEHGDGEDGEEEAKAAATAALAMGSMCRANANGPAGNLGNTMSGRGARPSGTMRDGYGGPMRALRDNEYRDQPNQSGTSSSTFFMQNATEQHMIESGQYAVGGSQAGHHQDQQTSF